MDTPISAPAAASNLPGDVSHPMEHRHYLMLLRSFRRLWSLPATPERTARMDSLILLIDEYEATATRLSATS
jgi:hypothetical protein